MKIPEITIQGWHHDGPVYRIHRTLAGWRHRKARRAGGEAFDQVGHPGGRNVEAADSFLVYASGDVEVYAFNRGHAYYVEQLVDGNARAILLDAREDYRLHVFQDGLEFLAARALTDEELAELEQGAELEQPANVSDGAESQQPLEVVENEAGEQHEAPEAHEPLETPAVPEDVRNVSPSGATGVVDLGGGTPPTPDPNADLTDAQVDAIDTALDEATEEQRELKSLAAELGVDLDELEALSPEERAELTAEGSTDQVPEGTPDGAGDPDEDPAASDDASGGDEEDAADEEE